MSADTLTADGAAVTISPPGADTGGHPFSFMGYAAVPGSDEIIALTASRDGSNVFAVTAAGYSLSGALLFQTVLGDLNTSQVPEGFDSPVMAGLANGDVAIAWHQVSGSLAGEANNGLAVVAPSGAVVAQEFVDRAGGAFYPIDGAPIIYATATGFTMEWNAETQPMAASPGNPQHFADQVESFDLNGLPQEGTSTPIPGWGQFLPPQVGFIPRALATGASGSLQVTDNVAEFWDGSTFHDPVTLPGEPAHAITDEAAAMLPGGQAAVGWVDSGTDYVALFNPTTNSFAPSIGLDWGGASDIHVVGLPDGGFAVSWRNGGAYKGEVFDSAGNGGGIIALAGDVAGVTNSGDLYTVAQDSSGAEVIQTYAIHGASGGGGATGQTFNSDNNGDVWIGTSGDDTFNLGRGGDWAEGNGGNDTFRFAAIPWASGGITDFNAGDLLDLTGLMSTTPDTGTDGFADGYLKITDDGHGDAQVWADYNVPGNNGWWLVTTLDGVAPSSLQHAGDVITLGSSGSPPPPPPASVTTSDATYTAPPSVNSITLAGSQQTVTASNAQDTTIWSNNTGNAIHGGTGDDTIHIGRGGDWVDGGAGKDVFVFDDIPWASATITALYPDQGDTVDVSGILAKAGYTGSDPIADGYLKITGNQIFADYHLPGNDGWWQVATVYTPGTLHYAGNGVIDDLGEQVGGTITYTGQPGTYWGFDTIVMQVSNGSFTANDGGDTLIDQGSNNEMFGGKGNDTLVLGTSTTVANDGWGGVNTFVMNPQSTVLTHNTDGLYGGDRLDVRDLLAASHYAGSDPVGDGFVFMANPPPPQPMELGDFVRSQLMYDPDGAAGPAAARPLFDMYYTRPDQFHYAEGFFVVQ